jgi:hypothetical protein
LPIYVCDNFFSPLIIGFTFAHSHRGTFGPLNTHLDAERERRNISEDEGMC